MAAPPWKMRRSRGAGTVPRLAILGHLDPFWLRFRLVPRTVEVRSLAKSWRFVRSHRNQPPSSGSTWARPMRNWRFGFALLWWASSLPLPFSTLCCAGLTRSSADCLATHCLSLVELDFLLQVHPAYQFCGEICSKIWQASLGLPEAWSHIFLGNRHITPKHAWQFIFCQNWRGTLRRLQVCELMFYFYHISCPSCSKVHM